MAELQGTLNAFYVSVAYVLFGCFLKGVLIRVFGRIRVDEWEEKNVWIMAFPLVWGPYLIYLFLRYGIIIAILTFLLLSYTVLIVIILFMGAMAWMENGFTSSGFHRGVLRAIASIADSWIGFASRWLLGRKKQQKENKDDVLSPSDPDDDAIYSPV